MYVRYVRYVRYVWHVCTTNGTYRQTMIHHAQVARSGFGLQSPYPVFNATPFAGPHYNVLNFPWRCLYFRQSFKAPLSHHERVQYRGTELPWALSDRQLICSFMYGLCAVGTRYIYICLLVLVHLAAFSVLTYSGTSHIFLCSTGNWNLGQLDLAGCCCAVPVAKKKSWLSLWYETDGLKQRKAK